MPEPSWTLDISADWNFNLHGDKYYSLQRLRVVRPHRYQHSYIPISKPTISHLENQSSSLLAQFSATRLGLQPNQKFINKWQPARDVYERLSCRWLIAGLLLACEHISQSRCGSIIIIICRISMMLRTFYREFFGWFISSSAYSTTDILRDPKNYSTNANAKKWPVFWSILCYVQLKHFKFYNFLRI